MRNKMEEPESTALRCNACGYRWVDGSCFGVGDRPSPIKGSQPACRMIHKRRMVIDDRDYLKKMLDDINAGTVRSGARVCR